MASPINVLLVTPAEPVPELFATAAASGEVVVAEAPAFEAALSALRERHFDLVMLDTPASAAAIEQLKALREARAGVKVIVVSKDATPAELLAAMREHAFACYSWPLERELVKDAIARALAAPDWEDGIELVSARPGWVSLRLRCSRFTADRVLAFFAEMRVDLSPEDRDSIGSAVREILLNAFEHGGGLEPRKRVQVSRVRTQRLIVYHIQDPGAGFSFDALPHAAVSNPPDDPTAHMEHREQRGLRVGGFGILVTRRLVDELIYNQSGNEAILIKHLDAPAPGTDSPPPKQGA